MAKEQELLTELKDWVTAYKDASERNALAENPNESAEYLASLIKSLGYEQVWEKCPECKGEGEIFHRGETDTLKAWSRCTTCNGTGKKQLWFKLPEGIEETIAKWLFKNRHRLPNQRFYANWYDETSACPLTEKEYLNLTNEILSLIRGEKE